MREQQQTPSETSLRDTLIRLRDRWREKEDLHEIYGKCADELDAAIASLVHENADVHDAVNNPSVLPQGQETPRWQPIETACDLPITLPEWPPAPSSQPERDK